MGARNSVTHPLRVDWANDEGQWWPGRLGMSMAPGKRGESMTGRWERDLEADLLRLKRHYRIDTLLSLLEPQEYPALGILGYPLRAEAHGFRFVQYPIEDGGVPLETAAFDDLVGSLLGALEGGERVLVHCMGGLGRTGLVVACVILRGGHLSVDEVVPYLRARRRNAVETNTQQQYIQQFR